MCLCSFESGNQSIGKARIWILWAKEWVRCRRRETIESDIEAKLESFALERMRMAMKTSSTKEAGGGNEHGASNMERGDMGVASTSCEADGLLHGRLGLDAKSLKLYSANSSSHVCNYTLSFLLGCKELVEYIRGVCWYLSC